MTSTEVQNRRMSHMHAYLLLLFSARTHAYVQLVFVKVLQCSVVKRVEKDRQMTELLFIVERLVLIYIRKYGV
jgi:hypothetical protein